MLQKVRIDFMFNHPFFSVLALSLKLKEDETAKNLFETNGRSIFFNSQHAEGLGKSEVLHLYAHVLLHVALRHALRRKNREQERWNLACDLAVEGILDQLGNVGKRPESFPAIPENFRNLSAEEIYERLSSSDENEESGESEVESSDDLRTEENAEQENHEEDSTGEELDLILLQAQAAASQGTKLPGFLLKEINDVIQPEIGLEDKLRDYLVLSLFEKSSDYRRPARRYIHSGLYLPGMIPLKDRLSVTVAIDSSASVSKELYKKFLGVIIRTCQEFHEFSVHVLPFDDSVRDDLEARIESFDNAEEIIYRIPKTSGGTDLAPLLDYLENQPQLPEILIVISDGKFEMYRPSPVETIFLITEEDRLETFADYGRVIRSEI